jgi:uncharacterized protein with von Willebrand factor type A (vWA) domain
MSEAIDKAADALAGHIGSGAKPDLREIVRVVLRSIREYEPGTLDIGREVHLHSTISRSVWQAAIDKLLEEDASGGSSNRG